MAWDDVVRVGGIPERSVTKQTNVLVIGDINPCTAPELGALPVTCGLASQHLRQDRGSWLFVCSI